MIGWTVAALYWGFAGYEGPNYNYLLGLIQLVSDVAVYILITHLYRKFSLNHGWDRLDLNSLVKRLIPSIFVLGVVYTAVTSAKVYWFQEWFLGRYTAFPLFISTYGLAIFMAGIRLMSIWLLAYHLYHYAQREIRTSQENARLSLVAKDAQLSNLAAQLHPHFLFNSLNSIKALVIESPDSARRAIDLLSELLRTSLYGHNGTLVSLENELSIVKDYLELEKMRMEERLQVDITVDRQLLSTLLPPLSIQTLVENGVKHGIDRQKKGGLIALKIERSGDRLKVIVCNPGKLDGAKKAPGLGLGNLTERLKLQYNGKATFDVEERQDTIFATLLIPIT